MDETGLRRSSFYHYLRTATDLASELLEKLAAELVPMNEVWFRAEGDRVANLRAGYEGVGRFWDRHGPVLGAIADAATHDGKVERAHRRFVERFVRGTRRTDPRRQSSAVRSRRSRRGDRASLDPHERTLPEREARAATTAPIGGRSVDTLTDDLAARSLREWNRIDGELVRLARRLVACDTTSARTNLPAIELLAGASEGHGFRPRVQSWGESVGATKANLVAAAGPPEPGGLIVCGHTDTVPWEGQPWLEPLSRCGSRIGDSGFTGRGTSDMKVFLAQAVVAAGADRSLAAATPARLGVHRGRGGRLCRAERLAPDFRRASRRSARSRAFCWIGEPTSWEILHAHKSLSIFDVTIRGPRRSQWSPLRSRQRDRRRRRACSEVINRHQQELRARGLFRVRRNLSRSAVFHDSTSASSAAAPPVNMIAEECVLRLSTRGLPDADPLEIHRELRHGLAVLDSRDPAFPGVAATIEVGDPLVVPAMSTPRAHGPRTSALRAARQDHRARGSLLAA